MFTFTPEIALEGHEEGKPLIAGKFYKADGDLSSVKWSAPTLKEVTIAEQYLFRDSVFETLKVKMLQFDKFALLVQKFKLQNDEIAWLVKENRFGDFKFQTTTSFDFSKWQRLADYTFLKKALNDEDGKEQTIEFICPEIFVECDEVQIHTV